MTQSINPNALLPPPFPDHTQLPESDGTFVKNFQEHPQSIILTDSIGGVLQQLHPDGQYAIGQDCGIYWRETEPPEKGAEAPDWFYVLVSLVREGYAYRIVSLAIAFGLWLARYPRLGYPIMGFLRSY